jgi:S1-C subfamily serine protease
MRWLLGLVLMLGLAACGASAQTDVLEHELQASVWVGNTGGHGSGVIVSPRTVLTNAHVAKMLRNGGATIKFYHGEEVVGRVAWISEVNDVALIDVAVPERYSPAVVSCRKPAAGSQIVTVGQPVITRWAASFGRVASNMPPDYPQLVEWDSVVLDVSSASGSSGSPVFNEYGQLVGLIFGQLVMGDLFVRLPVEYALMVPMSEVCWQMDVFAIERDGTGEMWPHLS